MVHGHPWAARKRHHESSLQWAMGTRKRYHESPLHFKGLKVGPFPGTHPFLPRTLPSAVIHGPKACPQPCAKVGERPGSGSRHSVACRGRGAVVVGVLPGAPEGAGCRDAWNLLLAGWLQCLGGWPQPNPGRQMLPAPSPPPRARGCWDSLQEAALLEAVAPPKRAGILPAP